MVRIIEEKEALFLSELTKSSRKYKVEQMLVIGGVYTPDLMKN